METSKLCNGFTILPLKLQLMQFSAMGNHTYNGETTFSINDIMAKEIKSWPLKNPKNKDSSPGILNLVKFDKEINYPFIDYLRGGMEINLITCIDYTSSNRTPSDKNSLHYMQSHRDAPLNQYQQAISSVGHILLEYDHDKLVPTYGFGG